MVSGWRRGKYHNQDPVLWRLIDLRPPTLGMYFMSFPDLMMHGDSNGCILSGLFVTISKSIRLRPDCAF